MDKIDYLLIGGGLATAKCAAKLREEGATGRIMIVGAELHRPYNRPPLSKGLLLGYEKPEQTYVYSDDFYEENKIELTLGVAAVSASARRKTVQLADGTELAFDNLLVATGTSPRHLDAPGSELKNIFYLRTLDDAQRILNAIELGERAVIVGAGFIGMELAAAFIENDIETTMLVRETGLFTKLASPALTGFFYEFYGKHGVKMVFEDEVDHFAGQSAIEKVVSSKGLDLPADMVAVGIGVTANTEWLQGSGVELERGIVVDEYLRAADTTIFGAGDVAAYYDPIFKKRRRVEHWDNAIKQGELAALNMLGREEAFDYVAYFYSDLFDLSWEWLGDNSDFDATITRGSLSDGSAIVFYLLGGRLRAAFLLMQGPQERQWVEARIRSAADLSGDLDRLGDETVPLSEIPREN